MTISYLNLTLSTDHAVPIQPGGGTATVQVTSGSTVYYSSDADVSSTYNEGSIVLNASASFVNETWVRSGGTSTVTVAFDSTSVAGPQQIANVIAPAATGSPVADTAALQGAINSTPVGGLLFIPDGLYRINVPLTMPQHIAVQGQSLVELWASGGQGVTNTNGPGTGVTGGAGCTVRAAAFAGVVIEQQTAGADVIQLPVAASTVHLKNIAAGYAPAIADVNTGTPFNCTPSTNYNAKPDDGLLGSLWENVVAFAHDGNHYGFIWVNSMYCTTRHLRAYGGGGYLFQCNSALSSYGNMTLEHPYCFLYNPGTAHGYALSAGTNSFPGQLGLIEMMRPQVIAHQAVNTAATQAAYNDHALGSTFDPVGVVLHAPDFENFNAAAPEYICPSTVVAGDSYNTMHTGRFSYYLRNVALGFQALGAVTASSDHVAIGYQASTAVSANSGTVAVGSSALKLNTSANSTAVGYQALTANTSGGGNTAVGYQALVASTGATNTAVGYQALKTQVAISANTAVGYLALTNSANSHNTALGSSAATTLTSGSGVVALGDSALFAATTGNANVAVGQNAGYKPAGTVANATVAGSNNTFVGHQTGVNSAGDITGGTAIGFQALVNGLNATSLGRGASGGAAGAVAIGCDNTGTGASTTTANVIALGTALHQVQIANNSTAAGTPTLGANCPATTLSAPYTWFKMMSSDGSTVYVPAWK